jgi:hypothetical protein
MGNYISYEANYDILWYQEHWALDSKGKQQGRKNIKLEFYELVAISTHICGCETLFKKKKSQ